MKPANKIFNKYEWAYYWSTTTNDWEFKYKELKVERAYIFSLRYGFNKNLELRHIRTDILKAMCVTSFKTI